MSFDCHTADQMYLSNEISDLKLIIIDSSSYFSSWSFFSFSFFFFFFFFKILKKKKKKIKDKKNKI